MKKALPGLFSASSPVHARTRRELGGDTSLYRHTLKRYNALSRKAFLAFSGHDGAYQTLPGFQATTSGVEKLTASS